MGCLPLVGFLFLVEGLSVLEGLVLSRGLFVVVVVKYMSVFFS